MAEQIDFQVADGVAQIGINRPEKKNALTAAMYAGLVEAFRAGRGGQGGSRRRSFTERTNASPRGTTCRTS